MGSSFLNFQYKLKDLKTEDDLSNLLNELHSAALEAMLQGEMDAHLGYPKNGKRSNDNMRNGNTSKKVKNWLWPK